RRGCPAGRAERAAPRPTGSPGDADGRARAVVMPVVQGTTTPAAPATEAAPPAVAMIGVSKQFGATQALTDVGLELHAGQIRALVGESAAGNSPLARILAGIHQPDSGTVALAGVPTVLRNPADARAHGIAVVHQEPQLFPDLSVAENVFIGHVPPGRFR